jgi:hypothetical protein
MPTLPKELVTPELYGMMIYCGALPIPDGAVEQVEKAFERLGGAMPERTGHQPQKISGENTRSRGSINNAIISCLSTAPMKMWTPRQVLSGIKSANPRVTVESLQTRMKNNAGKPGMWIVGPGPKYGMPGAMTKAPAAKTTTTSEANANVVPAPSALAGEKRQARVLAYITAYPGHTKPELFAAFAASPTPVKAQYVGVDLSRLIKGKKITDSENGPYSPLVAAKPTVVARGIGDGAAAPA